jgi:hypothetical protein
MDNPETLARLGTQSTRQDKHEVYLQEKRVVKHTTYST